MIKIGVQITDAEFESIPKAICTLVFATTHTYCDSDLL